MKIDISNIKQEVKDAIIKEHMIKYYHWTVGLGSLIIGILLGILIK